MLTFSLGGNDRTINAGHHKFVFLLKDPLYFVSVSRTGESESQVNSLLLLK